jgi:hypothetical protein
MIIIAGHLKHHFIIKKEKEKRAQFLTWIEKTL